MEKTYFAILVWSLLLAYLAGEIKGQCTTDADCSDANTVCVYGYCQCEQGFTILNGNCAQVVGRPCLDNGDCDDGRTECVKSECQCQSIEWREDNGKCISYFGKTCKTWSDCGFSLGYECSNSVCGCSPGYKFTNVSCVKVLGSTCNPYNIDVVQCPLENSVCSTYYHSCICDSCCTEKDNICKKVLGSSCDNVSCGNHLHHSYSYLTSGVGSAEDWSNYYRSFHLHMTCNTDNVCSCNHGFIADGIFCTPVVGRPCSNNHGCGTNPGYTCNLQTNTCDCSTNFHRHVEIWHEMNNISDIHYNGWWNFWNPQAVTFCISEIGHNCSTVNCSVENALCNELDQCVCAEGYTETKTGTCQQVLGMPCVRETMCQIVDGGTCGEHDVCVCKEGYFQNGQLCDKVIGSACSSDSNCKMASSVCVSGKCTCANGLTENNFRCLREECAVYVRYLPDIHRRFVHRKLEEEEPTIDDSLLVEGWYSIGKHNLYASKTGPEQGNCSTYHPIYMTETLTASQIENLKTGNLTISTTVGRHNSYEGSENITIKMRKCGMETHIYIKPPKIHFSGFCLSNELVSSPTRSTRLHAYVFPDLLFETKQVDNRTKHTPYLVFSCLPLEVKIYHNYIYSLYPHAVFQNDQDNFFYYVHWYLDEIHFKSVGPVRRKHFITETSLFESTILDAGFKLGFEIRCSIEITDDVNGQIALLANSKRYSTRVQENYAFIHGSQNYYNYDSLHRFRIPIGCESFEEDDNKHCELEWPVIGENGETICNITQRGLTNRTTCGLRFRGYTYKGYVNRTASWLANNLYYNYIYDSNDTHIISIQEYFRTAIDSQNDSEGWDFKIVFTSPNISSGHKIWEGYRLPVAKGYIRKWNDYMYYYNQCNIYYTNAPIIHTYRYTSNGYTWGSVVIDTVGEFLLYRSRTLPVEIHIQTEECTFHERRICICGMTYRNGGDIYIFSYCNGIRRQKLVTGDNTPTEYDQTLHLMNGMQFQWSSSYSYMYSTKELDSINLYETTKEILHSGEGLCSFLPGSYTHRNGAVMSTSEGFVSSWRLPAEESLHHPRNHKSFSWSQEYLLCSCPLDAKDREVYYDYNYTYGNHTTIEEYANVYLGHFQCSAENSCSDEASGEEWPGSLLPSVATKEVTARMEIRFNGDWPLLYLFCDFKTQNEYFYQIEWKLDGEFINRTEILSANAAEQAYITNDDIFTSKFLLEAGFSCEVSVFNDSQNLLMGGVTSEEIKAVEFVKTGVELRRGGDVTIQLRLNVPFVCKKNSPCYFELKFFDPKEKHTCLDSTIAVRNQHTCGKRITGVHLEADLDIKESLVNITLTTKNNELYMLRNRFDIKMKIVASGATSTFLTGTFSKQVSIFVRDDDRYWQGNYCYANNDPRMRTFDGQYYSNILVDEFVMMKHKRLPVEVQLETHTYGWYSCGVTVRAGRDVFTINHCHGDHVTGYLLADDKILRVRKRDEHRYQIYLPHGTMVDVMISSWAKYMVNVYIYPSPADMKEVEGLCGNFDGNIDGDLIHSDGNVTYGDNHYWWWWWYIHDADVFIRSWGLKSTNTTERSLTDIDLIEKTLESWPVNDVLCVCTGNDGNGEVKCSASEQATCVSPVNKPGEIVNIKPRQKRSGHVLDKEYKHRMRKMKESRNTYHTSTTRIIRPRSTRDLETAINECNRTLSSKCGIMTVKDNGLNVTFEELIYNCGQDRDVNPNTDWSALTCQAMEANVEKELLADVQFKENNSDIVSTILENLCVGNCSGNGICVKGVCECFKGFKASDCSLDLSKRVQIIGRTGEGVCDINRYDCTCIRFTTSGSLNTSSYTLRHEQFISDGVWTTVGTSNGTVEYDNFYEVFVCPEISRTVRSASNTSIIADQYIIALSNDGISFGDSSTIFVLDSTCLKVNQIGGSPTIELLPGFCIIDGTCYVKNVQSPTNTCLFCEETLNPYGWTRDKKDSCSDAEVDESSGSTGIQPLLLGIIAGAAGFVVVIVIVVLVACIVKKKQSSRVSVWDGSLYNTPKNTAFQPYELRKEGKTS